MTKSNFNLFFYSEVCVCATIKLSNCTSHFQGYEYFGYDPCTYFSSEETDEQQPVLIVDEASAAEDEAGGGEDDEDEAKPPSRVEDPVLEIDLDQVEGCGGKNSVSGHNQILCK